jgi:hypothetical protein
VNALAQAPTVDVDPTIHQDTLIRDGVREILGEMFFQLPISRYVQSKLLDHPVGLE